jgi:glutamyl-tRNA reductase
VSSGTADRTSHDGDAATGEPSPVDAALSAMHERAATIRDREVERALSAVDATEREQAVIEALADRLVQELLAAPERSLREADDEEVVETALWLFGE